MAKYTADIEIAVRGGRQIDGLIKGVNRLNNSINVVNKNAKLLEGRGFNVASMENYSRAVNKATSALNRAAAGTQQETLAVKALVNAIELENKARARREFLIAQEVANRRRVQATANAGFGIQGPQAAPTRPGRGPASPIGGTVNMPGSPAALRAAAGGGGGRLASRLGGAVSGAAIGGAFPLLFGQSGGAAAGGAIGGLAGGLLGPGGSFAGSLIGTILGDIAAKGNVVKQLGQDIGFSAEQTKVLEQSFKQAGREFDKFEASVQAIRGVGLAVEDQASAIQAASQLTETYGGKIDKITNAFAAALSSGKVTQATLNQLTQQGIPIQEKLAAAYGVSRSELLAMAKDGDISVQKLADAFIQLANEAAAAPAKLPTAYDQAFKQIQQAVNDLVNRVTGAFKLQTDGMATSFDNAVSRIGNAISQLIKEFTPLIETAASIAAAFINVGTYAASALLSIPGYVSTVINAVSLMIPGLSSVLFILQSMQNITGGGKKAGTAADYGRYAPGFMQQALPKPISNITVPSQLPAKADKSSDKARKDAEAAARKKRELDALLKQLDEQIRLETDRLKLNKQLDDALNDGNLELAAAIKSDMRLLDIQQKRAKVEKDFNAGKIQQAELDRRLRLIQLDQNQDEIQYAKDRNALWREGYGITEALVRETRRLREIAFSESGGGISASMFRTDLNLMPELTSGTAGARMQELKDELDAIVLGSNQAISGAEALGSAFSTAFTDVISGATSAQDAMANFFQNLSNYFLEMAGKIIEKWIQMTVLNSVLKLFPSGVSVFGAGGAPNYSGAAFGGAGPSFNPVAFSGVDFRAAGGPVTSGSPYIVGERGPELFVPGRSGTIIPNNAMGGSQVNVDSINITVENTGDQLSPAAQKQIAGQVRGIVLATLVDQRRGGGVLR